MSIIKLHKRLYFFTLFVSLISFSGFTNTVPNEKASIEVLYFKTSDCSKIYDFKNGLIFKWGQIKQSFLHYNFSSLLNYNQDLLDLKFINFTKKHIPSQMVKLMLKPLYFSSFLETDSLV